MLLVEEIEPRMKFLKTHKNTLKVIFKFQALGRKVCHKNCKVKKKRISLWRMNQFVHKEEEFPQTKLVNLKDKRT